MSPDKPVDCPVCRDIYERSALYERWLLAENYADGAMLEAVGRARGFCTMHSARLLVCDPDIAAPVANFALRAILAGVDRQIRERRGYHDALEPARLCPWCATEREALEYTLLDPKRRRGGVLCQPHAQADAIFARGGTLVVRSPLAPGPALDAPRADALERDAHWWSSGVSTLWRALLARCACCEAALTASAAREMFLRAGPQPNEHWEIPRLCVLHDVALGRPRGAPFRRDPDGLDRICDWCSVMARAAERTAELFALAYTVEAFRMAYASVAGLCLPHVAAATRHMPAVAKNALVHDSRARIATMLWELDERATRRSWQLRDQGQLPDAADLPFRAWWLLAGGTFRYIVERVP